MKNQVTKESLQAELTAKEFAMLEEIISWYSFDDNVCFVRETSSSEKGLITQLKNKELIYNSFEGMGQEGYERSNWYPCDLVLDAYCLEHY